MRGWRTAALVAAIIAAGAIGAALAPAAQGQKVSPRAFQIFGGGSRIGVSIRELDEDDVKRAKLSSINGVLVEDVQESSPAEKAGVKTGDIFTEFDGERVRGTQQFTRVVNETPAGRKVQASVVRDGQRLTLAIEPREGDGFKYLTDLGALGDLERTWRIPPPEPPATPAPPAAPKPPRPFDFDGLLGRTMTGRLGITVSDLSPQLADYFGTKDGVLVTSVYDDSSAAKAGLKAGDVITSFNGSDVHSPSELRRRTDKLDTGDEFTIGVVRDRKPMTLKGKFEDRRARRRTTRTIV